jgi:peptidoglycan/LPS O-acetylase OafA/YrhL
VSAEARPPGIAPGRRFSPELEGLRGVAILLVVLFHYWAGLAVSPPTDAALGHPLSPLASLVWAGHTGVTLFFVLSAYLLARPLLAATREGRPLRIRRFYVRRALRILPVYYLAVAIAAVARADAAADLRHGLPYLLFLDGFGIGTALLPYSAVWWSLATEVQFYVVLPWIFVLATRPWGRLALAGLALGWFVAWWTLVLGQEGTGQSIRLRLSLLGRGWAFLAGGAVAWLHEVHGPRLRRLFAARGLARGGADALLVAALLLLGWHLRGVARLGFFEAERSMPEWHVLESVIWAAVLLLVVAAPLRVNRLLAGRLLGGLGVLSYSIYLWHLPLFYRFVAAPARARGWPEEGPLVVLGLMAAAFALALAASALSYRFVEKPFLQRKNRVAGA